MENKWNKATKFIMFGVYILTLCACIYFEFSGLKYPRIRTDNWGTIGWLAVVMLLIPLLGLAVLFYKNQSKIKQVVHAIVCILMPVYLLFFSFFCVLAQGSVLCSQTENLSHYMHFDKTIENIRQDEKSELQIFPNQIPVNATEVKYKYCYIKNWTPSYNIFLSFSLENEREYKEWKESITAMGNIRDISESEDGGVVNFALIKNSDVATITYDDNRQHVEYYVCRE